MKNGNASPLAGQAELGNVTVAAIVVQGLLPCFTKEEQINVIVQ